MQPTDCRAAALFAAERVFEGSANLEQQLYNRFISDAEKLNMQHFMQ